MKIVVFRSRRCEGDDKAKNAYSQELDTRYADRVIGNLTSGDDFCTACGADCVRCRKAYGRCFGDSIAAVVAFPAVLPHVLEHPSEYVPQVVPAHDILIVICIHEQILIECLKECRNWGTRGVIVPVEAPGWLSAAAKAEAEGICEDKGIEIAFPKPFCNLRPSAGSLLAEFRETFHIGFPEIQFTVTRGVIEKAHVKVSAPCGATYYIARWLVGRSLQDDLKHEVISKRLHSYPCTGSMAWDHELGDTILHVAGQNHYSVLTQLDQEIEEEPHVFFSPTGKAVPKPVPVSENVRQIEGAKAAILEALQAKGSVSLAELRNIARPRPAVHSALLILKKEGRIKVEGHTVRRV